MKSRGAVSVIVVLLIALGGVTGWWGVDQHKKLITAHTETVAAQQTVGQLQAAEAAQAKAQAQEDADRAAKAKDEADQAQVRGTYHVAAESALKTVPPDVPGGLKFLDLAINADDPLSATTISAGQALQQATIAQQAQMIADLQQQLTAAKQDDAAKAAAIAADVKDKIAATGQIATLTGTVGQHLQKIDTLTTQNTGLFSQIGELSAKLSGYLLWGGIIIGVLFVALHAASWIAVIKHGALKVEQTAHAATQKALAEVTAAHTATKDALTQALSSTTKSP
jgi:hypothetical protein